MHLAYLMDVQKTLLSSPEICHRCEARPLLGLSRQEQGFGPSVIRDLCKIAGRTGQQAHGDEPRPRLSRTQPGGRPVRLQTAGWM